MFFIQSVGLMVCATTSGKASSMKDRCGAVNDDGLKCQGQEGHSGQHWADMAGFPTARWGGSSDEEIVVDEKTGGRKGQKLARFDLIPHDALWDIAEHFGKGSRKYEDRNWERGYNWSLSFGAMMRHAWAFWGGEDVDEETGSCHMTAAAWHAMCLLAFYLRGDGTDNRAGYGRLIKEKQNEE